MTLQTCSTRFSWCRRWAGRNAPGNFRSVWTNGHIPRSSPAWSSRGRDTTKGCSPRRILTDFCWENVKLLDFCSDNLVQVKRDDVLASRNHRSEGQIATSQNPSGRGIRLRAASGGSPRSRRNPRSTLWLTRCSCYYSAWCQIKVLRFFINNLIKSWRILTLNYVAKNPLSFSCNVYMWFLWQEIGQHC